MNHCSCYWRGFASPVLST